jgi:hypothetical protein
MRSHPRVFVVALVALCSALSPARAHAHGHIGHVHVTGWAIDSLPPGELRDFFAAPEVRAAALMGAGEGRPAPTDGGLGAQSLSRCPNGLDSGDNAQDFVVAAPTKGAPNTCPAP